MSAYFITAIGTGVGKTFVTAALAHQLHTAGKAVQALKPIVSGYEYGDNDTKILLDAMGREHNDTEIEAITPWRFEAPLSPHLAAAREGRSIDVSEVINWCNAKQSPDHTTLIEGAGGLMVPLTSETLLIDWIKALRIPAILVSSTYLGSINHTLLSLNALYEAEIPLKAIIISESCEAFSTSLEDTRSSLAAFCHPDMPIITIPRINQDKPWKSAPDLLSLNL